MCAIDSPLHHADKRIKEKGGVARCVASIISREPLVPSPRQQGNLTLVLDHLSSPTHISIHSPTSPEHLDISLYQLSQPTTPNHNNRFCNDVCSNLNSLIHPLPREINSSTPFLALGTARPPPLHALHYERLQKRSHKPAKPDPWTRRHLPRPNCSNRHGDGSRKLGMRRVRATSPLLIRDTSKRN
jgi:hypothetical protein